MWDWPPGARRTSAEKASHTPARVSQRPCIRLSRAGRHRAGGSMPCSRPAEHLARAGGGPCGQGQTAAAVELLHLRPLELYHGALQVGAPQAHGLLAQVHVPAVHAAHAHAGPHHEGTTLSEARSLAGLPHQVARHPAEHMARGHGYGQAPAPLHRGCQVSCLRPGHRRWPLADILWLRLPRGGRWLAEACHEGALGVVEVRPDAHAATQLWRERGRHAAAPPATPPRSPPRTGSRSSRPACRRRRAAACT